MQPHEPGDAADATVGRPLASAVSVVVPAYGHAEYIVTSIASALGQSPPPYEVIVIDDSSPDDTAERVAPLARAGRIRYARQPNAGMAGARNAGARLARGEYLYFLDDDDVMLPGALEALVDELKRHPDAGVAFGERVTFRGDPPAVPEAPAQWRAAELEAFTCLNPIMSPGQALIRRSAFEAVGGFDADIWGSDDWDLWLRLLSRFPGRVATRPVLAYRVHTTSASRDAVRMYRSSLRVAGPALRRLTPHARLVVQRTTYRQLRKYLDRGLVKQALRRARAGDLRTVATACAAFGHLHALELGSRVMYHLHLLRRGQLRLPDSDPLKAILARQTF